MGSAWKPRATDTIGSLATKHVRHPASACDVDGGSDHGMDHAGESPTGRIHYVPGATATAGTSALHAGLTTRKAHPGGCSGGDLSVSPLPRAACWRAHGVLLRSAPGQPACTAGLRPISGSTGCRTPRLCLPACPRICLRVHCNGRLRQVAPTDRCQQATGNDTGPRTHFAAAPHARVVALMVALGWGSFWCCSSSGSACWFGHLLAHTCTRCAEIGQTRL